MSYAMSINSYTMKVLSPDHNDNARLQKILKAASD